MPKTFNATGASHRIGCRAAFSEESVWRQALGPTEPLLCLATYGCLDATSWIPKGGHSTKGGVEPRSGNF